MGLLYTLDVISVYVCACVRGREGEGMGKGGVMLFLSWGLLGPP